MLAAIFGFVTGKVGRWIALAGLGAAILALVVLRAYSAGKAATALQNALDTVSNVKTRMEVEDATRRMSDRDVRERLRGWSRRG